MMIFGLTLGLISNFLDPQPGKGGLIGAVMLGVIGALVGGFLGNLIFGIGFLGYNFATLSIAVLASLMLLLVGRELIKNP